MCVLFLASSTIYQLLTHSTPKMLTQKNLEEALGDILSKATEVEVKNVIGAFDSAKTDKINIVNLCATFQKDPLKETVTFLKNLAPDYPVPVANLNPKSRNKDEFARDIISFINFLKPTLCLTCNTNYIPLSDDHTNERAKCYICKRPSHKNCYDKHQINSDLGVFFVCSECLSVKAANELNESLQQKTKSDDKTVTEGKPQNEKKDDESLQVEDDINEDSSPSEEMDCPLYKKRSCPHGLTGKREINGKPCKYKHRKLCWHFAEHGPSGCRFKNKCKFYHPPYCQNSLTLQTCLNKSCTDFHFKGTQRSSRDDQYKPRHLFENKNSPPVSPWNEVQKEKTYTSLPLNQPKIHQKAEAIDGSTRNFLERFMEEMKADLKAYASTILKVTKQPLTMPQQTQNYQQPQPMQIQTLPNQPPTITHQQEDPRLSSQQPSNQHLTPTQQIYYSQLYNQTYPPLPHPQPQQVINPV